MDSFGPLCAFLSALSWSIGSANYSKLSNQYSPFSINFARGLVALPLFFIAVFIVSGGWSSGLREFALIQPPHVLLFILSMIGSYGFGDALFLWSTQSLGVPGALAIASSYPLWTTVAGILLRGESVQFGQLVGVFLTLAGVIVVILHPPGSSGAGSLGEKRKPLLSRPVGVALAFGTSLMWALNSYVVSLLGTELPAAVANTGRMLAALAVSAVFGLIFSRKSPIFLPKKQMVRSLWLFGYEAFGGSYLFMYGLGHSSLVVGVTLSSLAPVLAVPIAWMLRTEKFSFWRTLGVLCVVAGLWFLVTGSS